MITFEFFGALLVSTVIYWWIPNRLARTAFLSVASLLFIAYYDRSAALIVVVLSGYAWGAGQVIGRQGKALYHKLSVVLLLLVLGLFKYLGLLESTLNSLAGFFGYLPQFRFERLLLPLGLSYIVFKLISYLTDIHWKLITPGTFLEVLCYNSLFTIFVAGPIERFSAFAPQLREPASRWQWNLAESAVQRIAVGLFKKLVLADWIGYFTQPVWANPSSYGWGTHALALLGYSFQIYLDFAGYSDLAIGSSRLFGLTIMENFDWPYLQPNISMFWQHWHMSLSSWIRDYLFFPLSGVSRALMWNLFAVPLIAMGLCGLWHGPAWHFALWGIWIGLGISAYQLWNRQKRSRPALKALADSRPFTMFSILCTFVFVTIGWIWFRGW